MLAAIFALVIAVGDNPPPPAVAALFGYLLLNGWVQLALNIKRMHDRDRSGWFILIAFIPLLNIWFLIETLLPGTAGANKYGPDPLNAAGAVLSAEHSGLRDTPNAPVQRPARSGGVFVVLAVIVTLIAAGGGASFMVQHPNAITVPAPLVPLLDPNQLSKDVLAKLIAPKIDGSNQQWCMNTVKIKWASNNSPITSGPPPSPTDTSTQTDNGATPGGTDTAGDPPTDATDKSASTQSLPSPDGFPLIFAEEAYVKWDAQDAFVMALLIGGGYIAVHDGGYPQSLIEPGTPGNVFVPDNLDQVRAIIDQIRKRGAVVDLTDKGRTAGVWDATNGFCTTGNWALDDTSWTPPATDAKGETVSHVTATIVLRPRSLGAATGDIDPMQIEQTMTQDYTVVKFTDGWRLAPSEAPQRDTSGASQSNSNSNGDDGGFAGAMLEHKLLSGHSDENGDENNEEKSNDDDDSSSSGGDSSPED